MNERIQELALQANAWFPDGYPSGEGGDEAWKNLVIFEKEYLKKFAELIVRKCMEQCEKQEYEYWRSPEDQEFTPQDCADAIARYFGVKE